MGNESVLIRTECLNTWFPGALYLPRYVPHIQCDDKKIIPSGVRESIQYGSPRTITSCIIIANENTSPGCVPPGTVEELVSRRISGAVHSKSKHKIII